MSWRLDPMGRCCCTTILAPLSLHRYPCTPRHRGLVYCMEYLEDNLEEWLGEELEVGPAFASHSCTIIAGVWRR